MHTAARRVKLRPVLVFLLSLSGCNAGGSSFSPPHAQSAEHTTTSSYAIVHSFRGTPDGYVPTSSLVSDNSGRLYGVTNYGGATPGGCNGSVGCGTFFVFDPSSRQETVLYSFGGTP